MKTEVFYGIHERQLDDMEYSPDDFNPTIELPVEDFCRIFRQRAARVIADYRAKGIKASRHLIKESHYTDEELSRIYVVVDKHNGKSTMNWGDFKTFLAEWEADWDKKHPLPL